jgi:CBS domain containing-hemolysin-like protein
MISGDTPLDELEDELDLELDTDASTLGGWVMEQTEKVPKPGDSFQWEGWNFKVNKADGRHVIEVEVHATEKAETDE